MSYAKGTTVAPEKTRAEIEKTLLRAGATKFVSGWDETSARIAFEMKGRRISITLPLPLATDKQFVFKPKSSFRRTPAQAREAHEAEVRRRWRELALVIKAKLAAVDSGISTLEREFLADLVIPGGGTLGEWAMPQIVAAYDTGANMPPLLGQGGS